MGEKVSNGNGKNRRRRILINKPLQLKYTFLIVLLIVMYSSCLGYSLYTNSRTTTKILIEFVEDNPKLEAKLHKVDQSVLIKTIIAMIINALVITYIGIFSTHKIAGPIYRFKKHLSSLKSGDFGSRTKLRKHDMLTDLADDFNKASEMLEHLIKEDIVKSMQITAKLNKLREAIKQNQISEEDVNSALASISDALETFVAEKKQLVKES